MDVGVIPHSLMEVNASLFKQNLQGESDGHPIKSYLNVHICVWYSIFDIVFWSVMTAVPLCCYVCTHSWQQLAGLEKRFLVDVRHVWQQCYVSKIHQWNACLYFAFVLVYLGSVLTVARYQEHVPPRPEESLPSTESWSLKRTPSVLVLIGNILTAWLYSNHIECPKYSTGIAICSMLEIWYMDFSMLQCF